MVAPDAASAGGDGRNTASNASPSSSYPTGGFSSLWGSPADFSLRSSRSARLLHGPAGTDTSPTPQQRPGTAPIQRGARTTGARGDLAPLPRSFSDRILNPKSRSRRRSSLSHVAALPAPRQNPRLLYTQKYKGGVLRGVTTGRPKLAKRRSELRRVLNAVVGSMSGSKMMTVVAQELSRRQQTNPAADASTLTAGMDRRIAIATNALASLLPSPPSERHVSQLAQALRPIAAVEDQKEEIAASSSSLRVSHHPSKGTDSTRRVSKHNSSSGVSRFWQQSAPAVPTTPSAPPTLELEPKYMPPADLVSHWMRGFPTRLRREVPDMPRVEKDRVRAKVQATNKRTDDAMHLEASGSGGVDGGTNGSDVLGSPVGSSEARRKRGMVRVFLHAMRAGKIDVTKVTEAFARLDADHSGHVDREEFVSALGSLGLPSLTRAELGALFDAIDRDGSGDLSVSEFINAVTGTMRFDVRDMISANVNSDAMDSRAIELDTKHKARVAECVATVIKRVKVLLAQKTFSNSNSDSGKGGAGWEAALMGLFMDSDVDHSGSVSKHEFQLAMKRIGVELEAADVDAVLEISDADKTGELEYWEFMRLLRPPKRKKKLVRQDHVGEGFDQRGGVPIFAVSQ